MHCSKPSQMITSLSELSTRTHSLANAKIRQLSQIFQGYLLFGYPLSLPPASSLAAFFYLTAKTCYCTFSGFSIAIYTTQYKKGTSMYILSIVIIALSIPTILLCLELLYEVYAMTKMDYYNKEEYNQKRNFISYFTKIGLCGFILAAASCTIGILGLLTS